MGLNDYRDEAGEFVRAVGGEGEDISIIMSMIDEEMTILGNSLDDRDKLGHQVYDVIFLLMELAARFGLDLDFEWEKGRAGKREKYQKNA